MCHLLEDVKTDIDDMLSAQHENYVENTSQVHTLISHVSHYPTSTAKHQFVLLSSVSHYHWVKNVTLSTNTKQKKNFNRFMNHMLYHPDKVEENSDHTPVPNSP